MTGFEPATTRPQTVIIIMIKALIYNDILKPSCFLTLWLTLNCQRIYNYYGNNIDVDPK